jgi:hypothetical protein
MVLIIVRSWRESECEICGYMGAALPIGVGSHKGFLIVHVIRSSRVRMREGEGSCCPATAKNFVGDRLGFVML